MGFRMSSLSLGVVVAVHLAAAAGAQDATYLRPPKPIADVIEGSALPQPIVSPSRTAVAMVTYNHVPTIAELSQPMLRLAGFRINPTTNATHFSYRSPTIRQITLVDVASGKESRVALPAEGRLSSFRFAPDGRAIALARATDRGLELWIADVATGQARALTGPVLNGTWGDPCAWLADGKQLLCRTVRADRGKPPEAPVVPAGPRVQEHAGGKAPVRTNQDLLTSAQDEALFEYYFTSQLAFVDAGSGHATPAGSPAVYQDFEASPSGEFILVSRLKRPYSRLVTAGDFPGDVQVLDRRGTVVRDIGALPLGESVPIGGVRTGPRAAQWQPGRPATVTWVEALDGGDPGAKVAHRDRLLQIDAPFKGDPRELVQTEYRFDRIAWTNTGVAFVSENDRPRRWTRTWVLAEGQPPRKLFDRSSEDRYSDPGAFVMRPAGELTPEFGPSPDRVVLLSGEAVYLAGPGASPNGDRPFLDRLDLRTLKTERLFRCEDGVYEAHLALLADDASAFLTQRETPREPPNVYVRKAGAAPRALTSVKDPSPELSAAQKQLLTYDRKDGVKLSATLYVPGSRKPGERLPLIVWAYPREFTDPAAAGQVTGSPYRFVPVNFGNLHHVVLLAGYALIIPSMPIVGPGETANDTYVEQLVASAQAAVDKAVEVGVADRERVGVAGHSYGAFMTANLLAHSDIFRAGIALSGAYNRTLTPFSFQNERRTFWEVPEVYSRMSPFWFAHKVNEPILLFHGEIDNNQGTFPIQSERFYMALKGHGATVRYVTLPFESHRYAARETLQHVAAEYLQWFDKYVKNAAARRTTS